MADHLPLIPEKDSLCKDVRPVLRAVFREMDYLPPLATEHSAVQGDGDLRGYLPGHWRDTYKSEYEELWSCEEELKHQHAERIAKKVPPNLFTLHSPKTSDVPECTTEKKLIVRGDLMPDIYQDPRRETSLWARNVLNASSSNLASVSVHDRVGVKPAMSLRDNYNFTVQSSSVGSLVQHHMPKPKTPVHTPPEPYYVVCVPSHIEFVNFTVGKMYKQNIRVINQAAFKLHLSIRPPSRSELNLTICKTMGVSITSNASATYQLSFIPRNVRNIVDTMRFRSSKGRAVDVSINCYMEPPKLHIMLHGIPAASASPDTLDPRANNVLELGTRLLGAVHRCDLTLLSDVHIPEFFVMSDEAWTSYNLNCVTAAGSVVSEPFTWWPAHWGAGAVRGAVWCRAPAAGLHVALLRALSSTATVRHIYVMADVLHFTIEHVVLDIKKEHCVELNSDKDGSGEYAIHLGTALPSRPLTADISIVNRSPLTYNYYWMPRPLESCSCSDEEFEQTDNKECLHGIPRDINSDILTHVGNLSSQDVQMEPRSGMLKPRCALTSPVLLDDAGTTLGTQRVICMLVLQDIPLESIPPCYYSKIIKTETVKEDPIPGIKVGSTQMCHVVCRQLEVLWDVVPVQFLLDPPVLPIFYSRRVSSVDVHLRSTQLYGWQEVPVSWQSPAPLPLPRACLTPGEPRRLALALPLPALPDDAPRTDTIKLTATSDEWHSECLVTLQSALRHPALRPAAAWLGVVPPGAHLHARYYITNDTYQQIEWRVSSHRWCDGGAAPLCLNAATCDSCADALCACDVLRPRRGALAHHEQTSVHFEVKAPMCDGPVATLLKLQRISTDATKDRVVAGTEARASLVMYRVLAPRVHLTLLSCEDNGHCCYKNPEKVRLGRCKLDEGAGGGGRGVGVLRPREALRVGRRMCCRLRLANTTPVPTAVRFDDDLDEAHILRVIFIPQEVEVHAYGEAEIRVVLEAHAVCARRLFAYRAAVAKAYEPLYLLVDTAICGVEVSYQIPIGGGEKTDSFVIIKRSQREKIPSEERNATVEDKFKAHDDERELARDPKCTCECIVSSTPTVTRGSSDTFPLVPVITESVMFPSVVSCRCSCDDTYRPPLPEPGEPVCLQYRAVPLRTVRTRTIILRNESLVRAHWSVSLRRWPRKHVPTLEADPWARDVRAPGVALQCAPARGELAAAASAHVHVHVYCDCWGLYYNQLLIDVESLEPLVVDVWVEAVGAPLQMALQPAPAADEPPTLWMSASAPARTLRCTNTSRAELAVHAYVVAAHESPSDALPFRLYLRCVDVPPHCYCVNYTDPAHTAVDEEDEVDEDEDKHKRVGTSFEVYLGPDLGVQGDVDYTVSPEVRQIMPFESVHWRVRYNPPPDAGLSDDANLMLRIVPNNHRSQQHYHRPEPPPHVVRLRAAPRAGALSLSRTRVEVRLCALDLPNNEQLRIRKRFNVINSGNGNMSLLAQTGAPWSVVVERPGERLPPADCKVASALHGGVTCVCNVNTLERREKVALRLPPDSSTEMCVEVSLETSQLWPTVPEDECEAPEYPALVHLRRKLVFADELNVLLSLPLCVEIDYPVLSIEPTTMDFGYVTHGDTRKTYFTVRHSSRKAVLVVTAEFLGAGKFRIHPTRLVVAPGASKRIYLQYTASHHACRPEEGVLVARGGARWCRAAAAARAAPALDRQCHRAPHDHTDDARLLPPHTQL